ncbi:MAG: class C beta-lactamase-related serine hydrolase, partial [Proteobacteria bacterium]
MHLMGTRELLEADLLIEKASGFFSDFYVEAGRLDQSAPSYSFGNSSSLFDLASLTKAIATGPLVHQYIRSHAIDIKASLDHWAPGTWQSQFSSELMNLTADELLAHRSGLPAWRNFWMGHLNEGPSPKSHLKNPIIPETFERIKALGEKTDVYSDLGYILLGYALEVATGHGLDELWKAYLKPFGVDSSDLGYRSSLRDDDDLVPSAFCPVRERMLLGEVHDENCAALGGVSGHAGLFGRGPAVGTYLRNLSHSNEGLAYLQANQKEL